MNAEYKDKWLKALRSGRYTQTKERLQNGRGVDAANCCLGVLCRVARLKLLAMR